MKDRSKSFTLPYILFDSLPNGDLCFDQLLATKLSTPPHLKVELPVVNANVWTFSPVWLVSVLFARFRVLQDTISFMFMQLFSPLIFLTFPSQGNWKMRQPNGGSMEECSLIELTNLHSTNHWHDVPCASTDTSQFICKKPAQTTGDSKSKRRIWIFIIHSHKALCSLVYYHVIMHIVLFYLF